SGYHHIRVAQRSQRYLGFEWGNSLYKFTVLPFGLSSAHIFTKLLKPLIKKWRGEGKGIAMYLDDGLIWGCSREECERVSKDIRKDLKSFAEGKCNWLPAAETKWLGFVINLKSYEISVSMVDRTEKALAILKRMLFERAPSLHTRMRWMGTLASLSIVISDLNKRQSRAMTASVDVVQQRKEGDILLDRQPYNGNISIAVPASKATRTQFYHRSGCLSTLGGGRTQIRRWHQSTHYPSGDTVTASSTSRELSAIHFGGLLVRCDNQAAFRICKVGSNIESLQRQAEDIWELQSHLGLVEARVEWIPREQNRLADKESRQLDFDSWRVNKRTTNKVQERWLHCEIDMFADDKNTICQRFFSRSWCPGIDAFPATAAWSGHPLWLVPPPNLVSRTLSWARHFGSFGILGCPYWPSQAYFLILKPDGKNWANFVRDGAFFPVGSKIFTPCPHSNIFNSEFSRNKIHVPSHRFPRVSFPTKNYDILTVRRLRSTNALLRCRKAIYPIAIAEG
ncbi:hypothetical protein COOONC_06161, partial [Cooperia oncophora]